MAWGGQRPQHDAVVDGHRVAVGHRGPGEGDPGGDRYQVSGAGQAGQVRAAGDVVVVDVGLHHVGDPHPAYGCRREDPVDVAGRVDRHRGSGAARQVAAVSQALGLDGVNEEHALAPFD
ncbi:hypothetical protein GCM10020254_79660 [Streptomyces goshikiensis]